MMTPKFLSELSQYPAFPETARTLIAVAGIDAAAALIAKWPGQEPSLPCRVGGSGTPQSQYLWARLVDVVGHVSAAKIVEHFCGGRLQIPNCKAVISQFANETIRAKFDQMTAHGGMSSREAVFELGVEYCLAQKTVERIIKRPNFSVPNPLHTQAEQKACGRSRRSKKSADINDAQGSLFFWE